MNKITLLFLSWRDIKNPKKGGAEVYTHEMLKRIDKNRYRVIHFSPEYKDCKNKEFIDGIKYIRKGNDLSVIYYAREYYNKKKKYIDFVVDQCNTHRFFTPLWVEKSKRIFFIHQLTREIWFIHAQFPINHIGSLTETPFLKLSKNDYTMTVSSSTKKDLLDVGFDDEKIYIIPEGIDFKHWEEEDFKEKEEAPSFIYVGRYAYYKGIDITIEAFGKLKQEYENAKLWLVGKKNEEYIDQKLKPIMDKYKLTIGDRDSDADIIVYGFVSGELKLELMSRAHALVFPSLREGWGLIITEAAAVGTPSIAYNSPGIVDAVDFGNAGYLVDNNNSDSIKDSMKDIIENKEKYKEVRKNAYDYSKRFHWDETAIHFERFIEDIYEKRR